MTWFAAAQTDFEQLVHLRRERAGIDPFTKSRITIVGPTYDPARLAELPSIEVGSLDPEVVVELFGPGAITELDRTRSGDASDLYRPFLEKSGPVVYRLSDGAAERLAAGSSWFADRLAARGLHPGREPILSDAVAATLPSAPPVGAEDTLVAAFAALVAAAAGRPIFGIDQEG